MKTKVLLIICLFMLAACTTTQITTQFDEESNPENHGEAPTEMPQFDEQLTQPVLPQNVQYTDGVTGYYVVPEEPGNYPGVIMIHEWWGLNEHIKKEARQLASNGYQVLAVDLFNGSVAQSRETALKQVQGLDQEQALANLESAALFLKEQGAPKLASLGWCFGGGQSMQLALSDVDLDATVIYYGSVETDEQKLVSIDQPVLGIFGSEDQGIPASSVREFESGLNNLEIQNSITIYDGVGHAFANPDNSGYAMDEAQDAWAKTLAFLDENLK